MHICKSTLYLSVVCFLEVCCFLLLETVFYCFNLSNFMFDSVNKVRLLDRDAVVFLSKYMASAAENKTTLEFGSDLVNVINLQTLNLKVKC